MLIVNADARREWLDTIQTVSVAPVYSPSFVLGETGEMTLLWGGAGCGKTWTALWLLQRLALLGRRGAILCTEGAPSVGRRVDAMVWPPGCDPLIETRFSLGDRAEHRPGYYDETFGAADVGVVVVDVLSAMISDENRAGDVNDAIDRLRPIQTDRLLIMVHHSSDKAKPGSGPRGSSRIMDAAAYDFQVTGWGGGGFDDSGVWPQLVSGRKHRGGVQSDVRVLLGVQNGVPVEYERPSYYDGQMILDDPVAIY